MRLRLILELISPLLFLAFRVLKQPTKSCGETKGELLVPIVPAPIEQHVFNFTLECYICAHVHGAVQTHIKEQLPCLLTCSVIVPAHENIASGQNKSLTFSFFLVKILVALLLAGKKDSVIY